ncbi:DUF421 domain-containing protein [Paenibacillus sp. P26]|nr:DUF421 domain-containing protein [Paenibacillus sp. P26]UUZ96282.1 DUF421 domain-containing protein [Paenibacillus sp. P25]
MDFYYITVKLTIALVGLWLITKLLGKKEISQLTAFDFVSSLMLSEIVGNTLYDKDVHFIHLLYALFLWAALSIAMEKLVQLIPGLASPLNGTADVIIRNGQIDYRALRRNNLDFDQLHTLLREQNVFTIREVDFAIFETNGSISVMKKCAAEAVTRADLGLMEKRSSLPVVLIQNGRVERRRLEAAGYDEAWLLEELKKKGIDRVGDVLYAEWMETEGLHVQTKY